MAGCATLDARISSFQSAARCDVNDPSGCGFKFRLVLATHQSLHIFGVPGPLHRDAGGVAIYLTEIVGRQLYVNGPIVLLQAVQLRGAWDGNNPWLLRQNPGESDLRGRRVLSLCDLCD